MNLRRKQRSRQSGFTLVELMVVVTVIALIGGIVVVNVIDRLQKAQINVTKTQIKQLGVILDQYRLDCGRYPSTEQGMEALVKKPDGEPVCKNYPANGYLRDKKVPKDGFDKEFDYQSDGKSYVITSFGNDNKAG